MDDLGLILTTNNLIKIMVSIFLGALIGLEREYHGRPAGLRTHILVSLAATLLIIGSHYLPSIIADTAFKGNYVIDPARMAAGIITGIGFLGAGVVLKTKDYIRGVTTAACIWFSASVGVIVGMGLLLLSTISTIIALVILVLLARLETTIYPHTYRQVVVAAKLTDQRSFAQRCRQLLQQHGAVITDTDYDRDNRSGELTLTFSIRTRNSEIGSILADRLGEIEGVLQTSVH